MILIPRPLLWTTFCKPRASGDDPPPASHAHAATEVNPARAGMIPRPTGRACPSTCKPRASGDDPDIVPLTRTDGYVNPARAGMIPGCGRCRVGPGRKPRASGDDPSATATPSRGSL